MTEEIKKTIDKIGESLNTFEEFMKNIYEFFNDNLDIRERFLVFLSSKKEIPLK